MKIIHRDLNVAVLLEQSGWLHALARGLVGDSHRAEELTQETLMTAVKSPPLGVAEPRVLFEKP